MDNPSGTIEEEVPANPETEEQETPELEIEITDDSASDDVDGEELNEDEDGDGTGESIEIDGDQITVEQYREMKREAGDRKRFQSEFTKKTQALADERKAFSEQRTKLDDQLGMLNSISDKLQTLVLGDVDEAAEAKLLEEGNTSEYLQRQQARTARQNELNALVEEVAGLQSAIHQENYTRLHSDLGWDDQGKHKGDLKAIQDFAASEGMSQEEFNRIGSPAVMKAIVEAQELRALKAKAKERQQKPPKTPKPASKSKAQPKTLAEKMYPNMK